VPGVPGVPKVLEVLGVLGVLQVLGVLRVLRVKNQCLYGSIMFRQNFSHSKLLPTPGTLGTPNSRHFRHFLI